MSQEEEKIRKRILRDSLALEILNLPSSQSPSRLSSGSDSSASFYFSEISPMPSPSPVDPSPRRPNSVSGYRNSLAPQDRRLSAPPQRSETPSHSSRPSSAYSSLQRVEVLRPNSTSPIPGTISPKGKFIPDELPPFQPGRRSRKKRRASVASSQPEQRKESVAVARGNEEGQQGKERRASWLAGLWNKKVEGKGGEGQQEEAASRKRKGKEKDESRSVDLALSD